MTPELVSPLVLSSNMFLGFKLAQLSVVKYSQDKVGVFSRIWYLENGFCWNKKLMVSGNSMKDNPIYR